MTTDIKTLVNGRIVFARLSEDERVKDLLDELFYSIANNALATAVEDFKSVHPNGTYDALSKYLTQLDVKKLTQQNAIDMLANWSNRLSERIAGATYEQKLNSMTSTENGIDLVRLDLTIVD